MTIIIVTCRVSGLDAFLSRRAFQDTSMICKCGVRTYGGGKCGEKMTGRGGEKGWREDGEKKLMGHRERAGVKFAVANCTFE